jgi:UDP-N-acetylglucosamine 2-epimerase (non-hydrolysing)
VKWEKGSTEPYPEQFDTRATAPTAGFHFAPVELNRQNLIEEGFAEDRIFVTGNTVSDAVRFAEGKVKESKIFEKYPTLEDGETIRFCIHRRGNVTSFHRFKAIFNAMTKLIEEERNVLLISLGATEKAMQEFGFKKKVEQLRRDYKNFIYSPVWPFYTDVIAATKKCAVIATDSGSMQEEANILGVPCVTLRFNSDRPESIIAGANILAPPISDDIVGSIVKEVADNKDISNRMRNVKNLYGEEVSKKIVDAVNKVSAVEKISRLEHERLGLAKLKFWERGELIW